MATNIQVDREVLMPLDSAKFIVANAKSIKVNAIKANFLAQNIFAEMQRTPYLLSEWIKVELHPKVANEDAIDWIFFVDCLNFSFWADSDAFFSVTYKGIPYTGYWSLCAAVKRALDEGIPITKPSFYSSLTEEQFRYIMRTDPPGSEMPLIKERLVVLHEAGSVLKEKYGGAFVNCVTQCNNKAVILLDKIVSDFKSFQDEGVYCGKKVSFYKRAQILIADIWACFEGRDCGYFEDIDVLTMFADYRVPQVLLSFGVLEYTDSLLDKIKTQIMKNGDEDEMEIRGASILAVDMISSKLKELIQQNHSSLSVNSIIIDFYLWNYRQMNKTLTEEFPFHKVRSVYY